MMGTHELRMGIPALSIPVTHLVAALRGIVNATPLDTLGSKFDLRKAGGLHGACDHLACLRIRYVRFAATDVPSFRTSVHATDRR